jgi:hypothetical protein
LQTKEVNMYRLWTILITCVITLTRLLPAAAQQAPRPDPEEVTTQQRTAADILDWSLGAIAIYRRSDALEKRRKLMEAWAAFCEQCRAGNVVPSVGAHDARPQTPEQTSLSLFTPAGGRWWRAP